MYKLPKLSVFLKHGFEYFVGGESKLLSEAEANEIIRRCEAYEIYKTQFSAAMRANSLGLCKKAIKHALDNEQAIKEAKHE